ncbi:MAG: 2-dehydro-3-deoxy-D-gluconate 5-dehydrogenase KduD [Chloroflexi bacterium]|nr:2-dehydro-3-deoxy-D-gluconate 5-dehydrogenase KduD [Chloroflexota bacterium]
MILDQFKLDGKVAFVTGAAQGLGHGYAIALAQAGADIVALDISDVTETGKAITALGRRFMPVKCNLREASVADLNKIVADITAQLGRLDILINNAGIIRRAPALEYSEKDWDDVLTINLRSVFFLSQAAARQMVKQGGGKIINIASMLSFQGGILVPSYTSTKSAVAGLTRALANEWAKHNINVNAIAPGYMATENTAPLRADAARSQSILDRIPAGRWGEATDLQGIVVFLASAASDYMQGAIVPVDGGWLAR